MITRKQEDDFKDAVFADVLDNMIDWINDNLAPEDVFDEEILNDWALENGFVKAE